MNKQQLRIVINFLHYLFIFLIIPFIATASLSENSTLSLFFWFQASGGGDKYGCYGYTKIDSVSTGTSADTYASRFGLPKYTWWQKLFPDVNISTTITINKYKPVAIIDASDHFTDIEWFSSIKSNDSNDSIRFYFPLLPLNRNYGRYDYFTVNVDSMTDLEFYGAGNNVMIGSFVQKRASTSAPINILARDAFIVELTESNPLRIHSIQCNGAYSQILKSYLKLDLDSLKKGAVWYGITIIDPASDAPIIKSSDAPIIKVHSVTIEGTSPYVSGTTHKVSWAIDNADQVDSCSIEISLDNQQSWRRVGKTGQDSFFNLFIPEQKSDSAFIRIIAYDKNATSATSISDRFSTSIHLNFVLSVQSYSENSIIASWNPSGLTASGMNAFCIAYKKGSIVKNIDEQGIDTLMYSLTDSKDTITEGLENSGTYYFTAFIRDENNTFSIANGTAIDSAVAQDLTPPENRFILSGKSIDSATIALSWEVDGTIADDIDSIGIWYSGFGYPVKAYHYASVKANVVNTLITVDTITGLASDKLYFFALFTADRNGNWSNAPSTARLQLRTPLSSGKTIGTKITLDGTKTQVLFSDSLKIWTDALSAVYSDTIDQWNAPKTNGFLPCGLSFSFRAGNPPSGTNVYFSVKYDTPRSSYSDKDIKVYRFNVYTGGWLLDTANLIYDVGDTTILFSTNNLRFPFALMIDTIPPRISNVEMDTATYPVMHPIIDNFLVYENIENPRITLFAGSGALGYSDISLYITSGKKAGEYTTTIPAYIADPFSGVRGLFIVNDGRNSDTINLSRKILRTTINCDDKITPPMEWTPLSITARPQNDALPTILAQAIGVEKFEYDNRNQRILRWLPTQANIAASDKWIEYSSDYADEFTFAPGKLFWIKTKNRLPISYGTATVPALIDTFEIHLKNEEWTEFSLPYNFDIYAGDIINATSNRNNNAITNLELYEWVKTENIYYTKPVFLPISGDPSDTRNIFKAGGAYTAYASGDKDVVLCIPPVCKSLSTIGKTDNNSLAKVAAQKRWLIKLNVTDNEGTTLSPIYCTGQFENNQPRFFRSAPSFFNVSANIVDEKTGKTYGHAAKGDLLDGGEVYEILYENKSDQTSTITTNIEKVIDLPSEFTARLYDKQSSPPSASSRITLSAQQKSTGYLIIGSSAFIDGFIRNVTATFSFMPLTFNHCLKVHYTLPMGVNKVSVSLFDLKGRCIEKVVTTTDLGTQEGSITVNKKLSSGYYIIQMRAVRQDAHDPLILNKQWLFVQ